MDIKLMQQKFSGKVIKGNQYGRRIGFPTVNLEIDDQELPVDGVYTGFAILDNQSYRAGIVVNKNSIEAHLIGYSGDAYGKIVTLGVEKFLREFENFDSEEKLIEQIKKDIKICSQE